MRNAHKGKACVIVVSGGEEPKQYEISQDFQASSVEMAELLHRIGFEVIIPTGRENEVNVPYRSLTAEVRHG